MDNINQEKLDKYIKSLLKVNNISMDTLAEAIGLSKQKLIQKLSGLGTFQERELIKIAAVFKRDLNDFLTMHDYDKIITVSEYQIAVDKGLEEVRSLKAKEESNQLDANNKYLIEYVIEQDKVDFARYLLETTVDGEHLILGSSIYKADVLLRIIIYAISHNFNTVIPYISAYIRLKGRIELSDKKEKEFFKTLNDSYNESVLDFLTNRKASKFGRFTKALKLSHEYIDKKYFLECISKYKLNALYDYAFNRYLNDKNYLYIMIKEDYLYGVKHFVSNTKIKNKKMLKLNPEVMLEAIKAKADKVFVYFNENRIFYSHQVTIIKSLINDYSFGYNYILKNNENDLFFEDIAYYTAINGDLDFYKKIEGKLTPEIANNCLALASTEKTKFNLYLLEKGAKFKALDYKLAERSNMVYSQIKGGNK